MPELLAQIARHTNRKGRSTWTAAGQLVTGRGAHLRALAASRRANAAAHTLRRLAR